MLSRARKQADTPTCKACAVFDLIDRGSACSRARLSISSQLVSRQKRLLPAEPAELTNTIWMGVTKWLAARRSFSERSENLTKAFLPLLVVVPKHKHAPKILLLGFREAAVGGKFIGLLKRAKETVPPSDVTIVEAVDIELVMD